MNRSVRHILLALTTPALLLQVGCQDGLTPTATDGLELSADAVLSESGAEARLAELAQFQTRRGVSAVVGRQSIGPAGGRFEFHGFAVEVPAGAVDRETQFTIRLPADPHGSEHVVAVFGPHNTTFAQPVIIEFPLQGTTIAGSADATVVWWDGGGWVDMGGSATADGTRLRTTTTHFSVYGTADSDGRGGVITASGG